MRPAFCTFLMGCLSVTIVMADCANRVRNLDPMLYTPRGEAFELKIMNPKSGKELVLKGRHQIEFERRIGIPDENTWKWANHLVSPAQTSGFHFQALGEKEWTGHMPRAAQRMAMRMGFVSADFVRTVSQYFRPELNPSLQSSRVDYVFNSQIETAHYYETPSQDLEAAGITLRIKHWFKDDETIFEPKNASARMLTLKIEEGVSMGFQRRHEYQIKISLHWSQDLIDAAARSFLQTFAPKIPVGSLGSPRVLVSNHRLGMKWMYGDQQIGFVTFDKFSNSRSPRIHAQIEVEAFTSPEQIKFFEEHGPELQAFFHWLENEVGGVNLNHMPKVRHE